MPYAAWHKVIQNNQGEIVANATVTVIDEDTGLPAVLYSDRDGTENAGNPVQSTSSGEVLFFVAGGAYRITASKNGFTRTLRYVAIGLAAEFDFVDVADLMSSTSTTMVAIGNGAKNFITLHGDRAWRVGSYLTIASAADPSNFMFGAITSYETDGDLVVDVIRYGGTGTFNDWIIQLASIPGLEGVPGIQYAYSTTTSMVDPGAGTLRLNNASPASVTAIAIDDLSNENNNPDVSAYILSWDDSTSTGKGHIILRNMSDPSLFAIFTFETLTDNAGWTQLNVTWVAGSSSLGSNGDTLGISFIRIGDKGTTGDPGNVSSIGGIQAGQFMISTNASGTIIKGADAGDSPSTALIVGTDAGVRAATVGHVLTAGLLESAAAGVALTDAATVAVDWDTGINFTLTVTANRTLGNPTNGQPGTSRTVLVQGNTDASPVTQRTLIFGNQYLGELPTLSDITDTRWYLLTIFCVTSTHFAVSAKRVNGTAFGT